MKRILLPWRGSIAAAWATLVPAATVMIVALLRGTLWPAALAGAVLTAATAELALGLGARHGRWAAMASGAAAVPLLLLTLLSPAAGVGAALFALLLIVVDTPRRIPARTHR
jgi:hypothetical protein